MPGARKRGSRRQEGREGKKGGGKEVVVRTDGQGRPEGEGQAAVVGEGYGPSGGESDGPAVQECLLCPPFISLLLLSFTFNWVCEKAGGRGGENVAAEHQGVREGGRERGRVRTLLEGA